MHILLAYIWCGFVMVFIALYLGKKNSRKAFTVKNRGGSMFNFLNYLPGFLITPSVLFYTIQFIQGNFNIQPSGRVVFMQILGLCISFVSLAVYVSSIWIMGKDWSTGLDLRKNHHVIKKWAFKYVRHPIYTSWFGITLSIALMLQSSIFILIFIPIFAWYYYRSLEEEMFLKRNLKGYIAYIRHTKRFIPFIF